MPLSALASTALRARFAPDYSPFSYLLFLLPIRSASSHPLPFFPSLPLLPIHSPSSHPPLFFPSHPLPFFPPPLILPISPSSNLLPFFPSPPLLPIPSLPLFRSPLLLPIPSPPSHPLPFFHSSPLLPIPCPPPHPPPSSHLLPFVPSPFPTPISQCTPSAHLITPFFPSPSFSTSSLAAYRPPLLAPATARISSVYLHSPTPAGTLSSLHSPAPPPSVRKQHNAGYKHKANVRTYSQQYEEEQTQSLIDQRIWDHLGSIPIGSRLPIGSGLPIGSRLHIGSSSPLFSISPPLFPPKFSSPSTQYEEEQTQSLIDQRIRDHLGSVPIGSGLPIGAAAAAAAAGGGAAPGGFPQQLLRPGMPPMGLPGMPGMPGMPFGMPGGAGRGAVLPLPGQFFGASGMRPPMGGMVLMRPSR
ncbi:unnamed protein product [Closterium sp. NIES-64]|nr:unnamed protein product [Closterium sp. NIES-64]